MWKEFKEFAVKGNAIDLAVGVIIGAAFGKIVTSIVEDLLMPPIGRVVGNLDFTNLYIPLSDKITPGLPLAEAKKLGPVFAYGNFIAITINFLIVAFCIFLVVKGINKLKQPKGGPPVVKDCPACVISIPIKATRCPHCTTELPNHRRDKSGPGSAAKSEVHPRSRGFLLGNKSLPRRALMLFQAAASQMPKSLDLAAVFAVACILVGCAERSVVEKPLSAVEAANSHRGRMSNVRTTAYTRAEKGGYRNALGTYLSGRRVMSAASDWSVFPVGTRFRIVSTREEYIIDDYGTALVGTNTIDLYKPAKLEMKRWGVRNVDIDILQWGSEEKSLQVLGPRAKHAPVRKMITALQKKGPSTTARIASSSSQSSTKPVNSRQASSKNSSNRTLD